MSQVFTILGLCGSFWKCRSLRDRGYAFEATHVRFSSKPPTSILTELRVSAKRRLPNMNLETFNRYLPCIRALDDLEGKLGSKIADILNVKSISTNLKNEFVNRFYPMVESLMHEEAEHHTPTSPDKMNTFDDCDESTLHISFLKHRILEAKSALDAQSVLDTIESHSTASSSSSQSNDIYVTVRISNDDICRLSSGSLVYVVVLFFF